MKKEIMLINSQLTQIENNLKIWNLKDIYKKIDNIKAALDNLQTNSDSYINGLKNSIEQINFSLNSEDYIRLITDEFNEKKLNVLGEFPKYLLGPFKINFFPKDNLIEMVYGKKKKRIFSFEPKAAVSEIYKEYKKLLEKPFNKNEFCKELLRAFERLNRNQYNNLDVKWGSPVSLIKIYDILTLKSAVKKEYYINNFSFDISKLKETDMIYENKMFELTQGTPKNAIVITNEKGDSFYFTSLTIHQK